MTKNQLSETETSKYMANTNYQGDITLHTLYLCKWKSKYMAYMC